jgi:hypothetical protein
LIKFHCHRNPLTKFLFGLQPHDLEARAECVYYSVMIRKTMNVLQKKRVAIA